jgi:hypothetical protein
MHQRCYDSSFLILAQHAAERIARGRHHTPLREQRGGEGASGGAAVAAAPILQQETLARGHSATYQTDFWFCLQTATKKTSKKRQTTRQSTHHRAESSSVRHTMHTSTLHTPTPLSSGKLHCYSAWMIDGSQKANQKAVVNREFESRYRKLQVETENLQENFRLCSDILKQKLEPKTCCCNLHAPLLQCVAAMLPCTPPPL